MSYYNLVKRNLNFFFNNLSKPEDRIQDTIQDSNLNLEGGAKKKKKSTKKKFNVLDFDINDLEVADEEVFTNSRSVNPFLKKKTEGELAEQIEDDDEGKPVNKNEDDTTENDLSESNTDLNDARTKVDEDESNDNKDKVDEDEDEIDAEEIDFENNLNADLDEESDDNSEEESDDNSDDIDNDYLKDYFNNSVTFGGRNISAIKDELGSDKDIEEYTKNVSGGLTGGNMKPIKRYNHKLYPYNLN